MGACPNCRQVADSSKCLQCDMCAAFVHYACIGLSETDSRITRTRSKNIKIICNPCSINFSQIKELRQMVTDMKTEFAAKLDELSTKLSSGGAHAAISFEELAVEVAERMNRSRNIVIAGVPEADGSVNARIEHDNATAARIVSAVVPGSAAPLRVFRVGKPSAHGRLMKVCLSDQLLARNILRQKHRLHGTEYDSFIIRDDKTPKQLEHLNNLRRDLEVRREAGERDLTIKYIGGIPKIVVKTDSLEQTSQVSLNSGRGTSRKYGTSGATSTATSDNLNC